MSFPPAILDLRVAPAGRRSIHLWLPLFLLWPLLLVMGVLSLVLTIIADVVLLLLDRPYHRYTVLLVRVFGLLGDVRGMVIRINDGRTAVDMTVQ